jgi:hypothetical protein
MNDLKSKKIEEYANIIFNPEDVVELIGKYGIHDEWTRKEW